MHVPRLLSRLAPLFAALSLALPAQAQAVSDFNADGRSDIFWRNLATGETYVYPMNGTAILATEGYVRTLQDQNWRVAGFGDFDGDGKADILWRNFATGENYVYLMNGKDIANEGVLRTVADQAWQVAGVGDFDGDGKSDILWRNAATGENYLYPMNGLEIKASESYLRTVASQDWQVAGIGDFNGDGRSDILWRDSATGQNYVYPMNGTAILAGEGYLRTVADQNWQVAGVGKFDADTTADILWRNRLTGENYLYPMNGTAILAGEGYLRSVADLDWQVAAVGDYNGDGRSDILWRNSANGENYLYPMNGLAILPTEGYVRTVPGQDWHIAGSPAQHAIDAVPSPCDGGLASNTGIALDYAKALDLCRATTEHPPRAERRWGLIQAGLQLADGTGAPHVNSRSIRSNFGNGNFPGFGNAMTVLSTGNAASKGQTNPPFAAVQTGNHLGTQSAYPADWLAANGGVLPVAPGCPALDVSAASDPVMLKLRIRVPSNARSFSVAVRYFGADFPEFVCGHFTDYFVALLDSSFAGAPANPADKNLAHFEAAGVGSYPVGVNLASGNTGLFQACVNGNTGCDNGTGGVTGTISACTGTAALANTGFEDPDPGVCNANSLVGGATAWLDIRGNVVPGETIELRFALWDTGDSLWDSLVLIDNFRWSRQTVTPGTFLAP